MTLLDTILYPALRVAGVITGSGRSAAPEQLTDCLRTANRMLDAWNVSKLYVYCVQPFRFTLSPPQPYYTVGPGGDFDMPSRPTQLDRVNLILPVEARTPLQILSAAEWSSLSIPTVESTNPTRCYLDKDWPLAKIYFYGTPTTAYDVELWCWQLLQRFQDTGDIDADGAMEVSFPPGYEDAIVTNVGVRMAQQFRIPLDPAVVLEAAMMRANIKTPNSAPPRISTSDMAGGPGWFDYRTGQSFPPR
jgi:hypothetical protein